MTDQGEPYTHTSTSASAIASSNLVNIAVCHSLVEDAYR